MFFYQNAQGNHKHTEKALGQCKTTLVRQLWGGVWADGFPYAYLRADEDAEFGGDVSGASFGLLISSAKSQKSNSDPCTSPIGQEGKGRNFGPLPSEEGR